MLAPQTHRPSDPPSGSRYCCLHLHADTCVQNSVPSPGRQPWRSLMRTRDRLRWRVAGHSQTRVHTQQTCLHSQSFLSLYPFIFPTFVPPQMASIPAFGSSPKRLTTPRAQPLHPMSPPACKGSQPPTDVCRQGSPLAHGAMAPPDSSRKAGAHFWEWVIGAPPPDSISVLLRVHRPAFTSWLLSCDGPGSS